MISGRPRGLPAGTRWGVTALLVALATTAALLPGAAGAHGLVGRSDLPIPDWLFAWGASIILIVSFAALTLAWRQVRFEDYDWRAVGDSVGSLLIGRPTRLLAGSIGVALLLVVVWAGIEGVESPSRNFSVTFVFVTFWLGVVGLSVVFGDVFRAFNPWRAIGLGFAAGFSKLVGRRVTAPLPYPDKLGRWPAVVGLFAFLFLELVWGQAGFATAGVTPMTIAVATIIYSAITFAAMALFGVERWIDRGETFSQYFGMFASLSPFEVRDGKLGRRPFLAGSTRWADCAGSLALVMVAIGGTTFDGASEGALKDPISSAFQSLIDGGLEPVTALRIINAAFLTATIGLVSAIFWAGIYGMRTVDKRRSASQLGHGFAHAFIAIALAYLVAHYFSLFVYQEQAQFTFLLADPLGNGTDYFGLADVGIDYGLVSATAIWYVQFGAIVVGHVIALALGHDRALKLWPNYRDAAYSQIWMLVTMVLFSVLGLFLLSQANG